jgi:endo-1,4-beta-xylanase/phosphatidylinositol alpha-1,6-mannosyltransferase
MAIRILILTSEYLPVMGGIGTYARELAAAATDLGAEVTVVAPDYGQGADDRFSPFKIVRFGGGRHRARDLPAKIRLVRKLLLDHRYDVIHAVDWPFFIPLKLAQGRHKARCLITLHGTEINELAGSYKRSIVRFLKLFDGWAKVVTNSDFTRRLLFERFDVRSPENVVAEPLGVSSFWGEAARPREQTRAELGLSEDAIVLVTVARLTERKGQLTVIDALRLLSPDIAGRCCYLIVGPTYDGDFTQRIHDAQASSGLDVRILGEMADEQVRDIYAASDIFCLVGGPDRSGRVEGFGLVLLEAGAQGLPAIASATGGVPEVVRDAVSGILVPAVDPVKTSEAISALSQRPQWRQKLGTAARRLARDLTWHRCAIATYGLSARQIKLTAAT